MQSAFSERWRASSSRSAFSVETGTCPHTAVREDPSMNLATLDDMEARFPDTDVVLIESGGDNSTLTFCAAPVEFFIYVIDVAAGDKVLRKNGPAITQSHILVMNKIDLAPYVGAALDVMARDSKPMRATNRSCSPTAAPARVSPSRFKSSVGICCSTCD